MQKKVMFQQKFATWNCLPQIKFNFSSKLIFKIVQYEILFCLFIQNASVSVLITDNIYHAYANVYYSYFIQTPLFFSTIVLLTKTQYFHFTYFSLHISIKQIKYSLLFMMLVNTENLNRKTNFLMLLHFLIVFSLFFFVFVDTTQSFVLSNIHCIWQIERYFLC